MPHMKYVTWKGRDSGAPTITHNIPVTLIDASGAPVAGKVPAIFRRDYASGRLVYSADMNGEYAAVIQTIEATLDPNYFEVSDVPPPPDTNHLRTVFESTVDMETFRHEMAMQTDPTALRALFMKMRECGVNPSMLTIVENRIDAIEETSSRQQKRYDEYRETAPATDEAAAPRPKRSRQAPSTAPVTGAGPVVSSGAGAA